MKQLIWALPSPAHGSGRTSLWRQAVLVVLVMFMVLHGIFHAPADEGKVHLQLQGTNLLLQVEGDQDDDWRIETSTNLCTWTALTNFGTLLSGYTTNAPWRSSGAAARPDQF